MPNDIIKRIESSAVFQTAMRNVRMFFFVIIENEINYDDN